MLNRILIVCMIGMASQIAAQTIDWTFTYDGPDSASDYGRAIARSGNSVCIVGELDMGSHDDAVAISVNGYNGNLNWVSTFDGGANDYDNFEDVVICGNYVCAIGTSAITSSSDYFTVCGFDLSSGYLMWTWRPPTSAGDDNDDQAICTDGNFVYAAGDVSNSLNDTATVVKIDPSTGNASWEKHVIRGHFQTIDFGGDLMVYSAGYRTVSSGVHDFAVARVSAETGIVNWWISWDLGSDDDEAYVVKYGADGGLYAGGRGGTDAGGNLDFIVMKIDRFNPNPPDWFKQFNGSNTVDACHCLLLGDDGYLYAGGSLNNLGTVIKLNASNGDIVWQNYYASSVMGIVWGNDDFLYASTGTELIKINPSSGNTQWTLPFSVQYDIVKGISDILYIGGRYAGDVAIWRVDPYGPGIVENQTEIGRSNYFNLSQNFPNPVFSRTIIKYYIANPCKVELKLFNIAGRQIAILANESQTPGYYQVNWDIRNLSKTLLPNGVYFYRLTGGEFTDTKKLVIMR